MNEQFFTFEFNQENSQRLDKYLAACLPDLSRSRIQALIKEGNITINDQLPRKSGQMLDNNTIIKVHVPVSKPTNLIPESIPLDIIFENENLLVVNKSAGMVVHPAAGHATGTLVHAALAHSPEMEGIGGEQRPGVVHRLDKDTSGLILMAKNDRTHRFLQDQFRQRKVKKTYITLVDGHPPTPIGRIEAPIGRDAKSRKKMAVVSPAKGRQAASEYKTLETFPNHTFLEVQPVTGRTHQIRLHMAFLGCPVTGDTVYGHRKPTIPIDRHFLHAARLEIQLQGESTVRTFVAPLPEELQNILDQLRSTH